MVFFWPILWFSELVLFPIQHKAQDLGEGWVSWGELGSPACPLWHPQALSQLTLFQGRMLRQNQRMSKPWPAAFACNPPAQQHWHHLLERELRNFRAQYSSVGLGLLPLDGAKIKLFDVFNTFYTHSRNCVWREPVFERWNWLFQCSVPF